jgi:hypothetical protein
MRTRSGMMGKAYLKDFNVLFDDDRRLSEIVSDIYHVQEEPEMGEESDGGVGKGVAWTFEAILNLGE